MNELECDENALANTRIEFEHTQTKLEISEYKRMQRTKDVVASNIAPIKKSDGRLRREKRAARGND